MASNRKYEEPHPKHRPAGVPAQPRAIADDKATSPASDEGLRGASISHIVHDDVDVASSPIAKGDRVRFAHQPDGPDHVVANVKAPHPDRASDGPIVELEDSTGQFAAHLFIPAPAPSEELEEPVDEPIEEPDAATLEQLQRDRQGEPE